MPRWIIPQAIQLYPAQAGSFGIRCARNDVTVFLPARPLEAWVPGAEWSYSLRTPVLTTDRRRGNQMTTNPSSALSAIFPGTEITYDDELVGPWRVPRQMLADQSYDRHSSIHDDGTAQKLGFKGGTIEGPTHFSQFVPLAVAAWGPRWLVTGCISAHYRAPVYAGEEVRARMARVTPGQTVADIWMEKADGTEVLRGTCSIGPDHPESALDRRLASLPALDQPVILEGGRNRDANAAPRGHNGFRPAYGASLPFYAPPETRRDY